MLYIKRSIKYFFALCVLVVVVVALNTASGLSGLNFADTASLLLHTNRGMILCAAIVVLSAAYPKFGFVKRQVTGEIAKHRQQIENAFTNSGFKFDREAEGALYFHADGILRKVLLLGEDEIKVSQQGNRIELDGIRRGVVRVEYRLSSYMDMLRDE